MADIAKTVSLAGSIINLIKEVRSLIDSSEADHAKYKEALITSFNEHDTSFRNLMNKYVKILSDHRNAIASATSIEDIEEANQTLMHSRLEIVFTRYELNAELVAMKDHIHDHANHKIRKIIPTVTHYLEACMNFFFEAQSRPPISYHFSSAASVIAGLSLLHREAHINVHDSKKAFELHRNKSLSEIDRTVGFLSRNAAKVGSERSKLKGMLLEV